MLLTSMRRTQIYLTDEIDQDLRVIASATKAPLSQVIRAALTAGLARLRQDRPNGGEGLVKLAALGKQRQVEGPATLSTDIDALLYD
jgi:predicted transcriptional regulator